MRMLTAAQFDLEVIEWPENGHRQARRNSSSAQSAGAHLHARPRLAPIVNKRTASLARPVNRERADAKPDARPRAQHQQRRAPAPDGGDQPARPLPPLALAQAATARSTATRSSSNYSQTGSPPKKTSSEQSTPGSTTQSGSST